LKPFEKLESAKGPDGTVLTLYRHAGALRRAGLHVDVVQERVHATSRRHHTLIVAQLR
jgi:hypothetical protein